MFLNGLIMEVTPKMTILIKKSGNREVNGTNNQQRLG